MISRPTTSPSTLLGHAQDVLRGIHPIPRSQAPRAAAVLARQALEDAVRAACKSAGAELDQASMRSCLVGLRVLADNDVADLANVAWTGLSQACHHHAYELMPTAGEVQHFISLVSNLAQRTSQAALDDG